jgi:hypothetical protein
MSKMFGTQVGLSTFLGSISFAYFFLGIAMALMLPWAIKTSASSLFAQPATMTPSVPVIIGGVLALYGFILLVLGVIQAAEITAGQFIVIFILFGILAGGLSWYVTTYQVKPKVDAFVAQVTGLDPSKPGFQMPDSGGGGGGLPSMPPPAAAPTPAPSAPSPPGGGPPLMSPTS